MNVPNVTMLCTSRQTTPKGTGLTSRMTKLEEKEKGESIMWCPHCNTAADEGDEYKIWKEDGSDWTGWDFDRFRQDHADCPEIFIPEGTIIDEDGTWHLPTDDDYPLDRAPIEIFTPYDRDNDVIGEYEMYGADRPTRDMI